MTTILRAAFAVLLGATALTGHPMGNFSVNHYARLEVGQPNTKILFVLDLAELPSFDLLQRWGLTATSPRQELQRKAAAESRGLVRQLRFTVNGKQVTPVWESVDLVVADGAGGLPVLRLNSHLTLAAEPGSLRYEDGTYPDRSAGWKEVVVKATGTASLTANSAGSTERSQALTAYPQDPTLSPPQELAALIEWKGKAPTIISQAKPPADPPSPSSAELPPQQTPRSAATGATVAEPNSMGQVRRGDFLSSALQGKEIGWGLGLICVAVAFWFGALHALEPGHGKTMVAAYLVGERGTPKHAIFLGGMVTFTHTVSVFILGLLTMFLSQYIMPDVISKWLGVISGLTIVWIGGLLLYRRVRAAHLASHAHGHDHHGHSHTHEHGHSHTHEHGHSHPHEHTHAHEHSHSHEHTHAHVHEGAQEARLHTHSHGEHEHTHTHGHTHEHAHGHSHDHSHQHSHEHGALTHTHDGHTHSHVIEGEISMKSLIALGASGGLVPCPSALVLLLAAVSVGRTGFGLLLLVSFSLGLALVLMATGLVVLYAKRFLPTRDNKKSNPLMRLLPIVSAAVITIIGIVLTGNALGLIPVVRFFG